MVWERTAPAGRCGPGVGRNEAAVVPPSLPGWQDGPAVALQPHVAEVRWREDRPRGTYSGAGGPCGRPSAASWGLLGPVRARPWRRTAPRAGTVSRRGTAVREGLSANQRGRGAGRPGPSGPRAGGWGGVLRPARGPRGRRSIGP